MLATSAFTPGAIAILCALIPTSVTLVVLSLGNARKQGRLEQKVDGLVLGQQAQAAALLAAQTAQNHVMEALVVRLEALATNFNAHTVTDASNFGEIRGLLHGATSAQAQVATLTQPVTVTPVS